jgi:hypothetical protein
VVLYGANDEDDNHPPRVMPHPAKKMRLEVGLAKERLDPSRATRELTENDKRNCGSARRSS